MAQFSISPQFCRSLKIVILICRINWKGTVPTVYSVSRSFPTFVSNNLFCRSLIYLPKTVEVELADKTFKFLMPEELRIYFNSCSFSSLNVLSFWPHLMFSLTWFFCFLFLSCLGFLIMIKGSGYLFLVYDLFDYF